jgi:hypothetical protein
MFACLSAPGRRPRLAPFVAAPLLAAMALSAGCGDDDDTNNASRPGDAQAPPVVSAEAVEYFGGITDETFRAMVGVPPVVDDARAATFVAPAAGATMSAASPPTFAWATPVASAPAAAGRSLWARAWELIEKPAYAHGKPYDGAAYLLSIVSASGEPLLTALTPQTSYVPDADTWAALASAAGGDVRVFLVTARCEQNTVADGGPWEASSGPITLRLGP